MFKSISNTVSNKHLNVSVSVSVGVGDFNKVYFEFLKFIELHLKNDNNFKSFYRKNIMMKETNPKYFIKSWYTRITYKYYNEIKVKDISFFLNKDYNNDINNESQTNLLLSYINKFKDSYDTLDETIKSTFVQFICELTELSFLYYKQKDIKSIK